MRILSIFTAALASIVFSACTLKELDYLAPIAGNVEVEFNWQKAPNHKANSMSLYLYNESKTVEYHTFRGDTGGQIQTGVGLYNAICVNEDDIYRFIISGNKDFETFMVSTNNEDVLAAMGVSTRAIPRAEQQPFRSSPARLWGTGLRDINIINTQETQRFTMYPEELVCKYSVDIIDVQNLGNVEAKFDASISSMAAGVYPGLHTVSDEAVSNSFLLQANKANNRLSSTFYTFGVPAGDAKKHILSIYFLLKDGSGKMYNIDVTKQVNEAPNPKDVHILIRGLVLPDTKDDINNTNVSVTGWKTVYINLTPPH